MKTDKQKYIEEMIILGKAWDIPEQTISQLILNTFNQKEENNG
tara:strand:- start:86 stop:214 length:129 start_codon:yes stop_codon:yes gene_type:complete